MEDNTIVMFISDHGCHFKTRNAEYKRSPHDSSIHVPLIVQGPGFDRALEIPEFVSQVNLAPTLLEAARFPFPARCRARAFCRCWTGKLADWPNEVYIGMREFVTGRILRTPEWTYAVAAPKRPGWKAAERSDQLRRVHALRLQGRSVSAHQSGGI